MLDWIRGGPFPRTSSRPHGVQSKTVGTRKSVRNCSGSVGLEILIGRCGSARNPTWAWTARVGSGRVGVAQRELLRKVEPPSSQVQQCGCLKRHRGPHFSQCGLWVSVPGGLSLSERPRRCKEEGRKATCQDGPRAAANDSDKSFENQNRHEYDQLDAMLVTGGCWENPPQPMHSGP